MRAVKINQNAIAKLPEDERLYAAIGRFVVGYSNLEMVLKVWIADSVRLPSEFHDQILTQDFAMLCNIAQNVLPAGMKEGAEKALKPIIGRFHDLNLHRVRIAHGWWLGTGKRGVSHVSRQKLRAEHYYTETPSDIAALADRIIEVEMELREWYDAYKIKPRKQ